MTAARVIPISLTQRRYTQRRVTFRALSAISRFWHFGKFINEQAHPVLCSFRQHLPSRKTTGIPQNQSINQSINHNNYYLFTQRTWQRITGAWTVKHDKNRQMWVTFVIRKSNAVLAKYVKLLYVRNWNICSLQLFLNHGRPLCVYRESTITNIILCSFLFRTNFIRRLWTYILETLQHDVAWQQ